MKKTTHNRIGILGLGSLSTLFYIQEMNALYNSKYKGFSTFPFKMLNTNFEDINPLLPAPSKALDRIVKTYLETLISMQIKAIIIPNITLHETIDRLKLDIPIIHPVQCVIKEINKANHQKITLIGSKHTMESNYLLQYFNKNDIKVERPSKAERVFIDQVRKQIYDGEANQENLNQYNQWIQKYAIDTAVVVACTELSMALSQKNKNVFDMAQLQIKEALKVHAEE